MGKGDADLLFELGEPGEKKAPKRGKKRGRDDMQKTDSVGDPKEEVDVLGRKVWDKEFYAKKGAERAAFEGEGENDFGLVSETKKKLPPPPAERLPLRQRKYELSLESELGKSKVVTAHTPKQHQGGYWCEVCECLLKDSQTYLDHINGRRHNRMLGMTMRVERVSVESVRERLKMLKSKSNAATAVLRGEEDVEDRMEHQRAEEEERKRTKRERKKRKRKAELVGDGDGLALQCAEQDSELQGTRREVEDEETKLLRKMGLPVTFS